MAKKNSTVENRIKNRYIDLTKTGPMSYRELQMLNEGLPQESEANSSLPDNIGVNTSLDRAGVINYTETPSDWGDSMFDSGVATQYEYDNYGDFRANRQPWYAKIGAGLTKGVVLAGTTLLNGTVGLLYGMGTAINEGKWSNLWDNEVLRTTDALNKEAEELLPNYYSQDELNQPWYKNIFTANFLGDKLLKNIGFTVGAFYSGGIYSRGLGAIMQAAKAGSKATSIVTSNVGSVISAVNEGSIEALNAANEFEEKYKPALDAEYQRSMDVIQAEYEANAMKSLVPTGDGGFVDPAYIKYQENIKKLQDNYNKTLAKLEEDKAKVGNATLLMNTVMLTASNFYQFGKLYSRGFNTSRRLADVTGDIGKYQGKGTSKLSKAGRVLGGGIAEGTEEVAQQIASDISQHYYATDVNNYYRSLQDPKASEETLSWIKSTGETLGRTLSEGSTWEQFFIGGVTGFMGMPRFRNIRNEDGKLQSPIVLDNNVFSKWRELKQESDRNQTIANYMNERVNSPEFKNYYQGLIRHNKYQNDMNDASIRNDEFDYKNAEQAQFMSDISMFSNAGRLDDLKTLIDSAYDTSDENIQAIIDNTTATIEKDGREITVGPFIDKNGNPMAKEEIINELTNQKNTIFNTIDNYVKTKDNLDKITGQRFTDSQLDELTGIQVQLNDWDIRANEMSKQVRDTLNKAIDNLSSILDSSESVGIVTSGEDYKPTARTLNNLHIALRNFDKENIVPSLIQYPFIVEQLKKQIAVFDNNILDASDRNNVINTLDDLSRLGEASKLYRNKFAEYLKNPNKIEEDHADVDAQNVSENEAITREKQVEALNNTANFQEVEALINNGEVSIEDLNNSNSEAANNYRKASLFKKKAIELINSSDSENKSNLLDMLNRRFNENSNYNDLVDERLVTELPIEVLDSKTQETIENEFNNILKVAGDKVDSGDSQKTDVNANKTGINKPVNAGNDNVSQPPVEVNSFDTKDITNNIDKLNINSDLKKDTKELVDKIDKDINKLDNKKDILQIRQIQRNINKLFSITGNKIISRLIERVQELFKNETFNPSSPEEVLKETEAELGEYKPTAVTGVLKAVIPQFDLNAKRDGVLIDFVGDNRNQGYSYVYNKLKEINEKTGKSAFDYVNEGNIKEGDELEVIYEEPSDNHSELLALYHKGTLVNYMNTDESIEGVKDIKNKAKRGERPTVRVSKIMDGQYGYDRTKTQSIGELLGTDNAVIGVMKNRSMEANTNTYVEPVFDEANSDGSVYILLPNSKGTLSPKKLYIRHLNKAEYDLSVQDNPIANELRKTFNDIAELVNKDKGLDEALDYLYMDLMDILYLPDSFHINIVNKTDETSLKVSFEDRTGIRQNRYIVLKRYARKSLASFGSQENTSEDYTASPEDIYKQVVDVFYEANLAFNINSTKLTGKKGQEYANQLRDSNVLATYLTGKRMQGTWFLLNEQPNSTHTNDAFQKAKAEQQAKGGIRVPFNNTEYFVKNGIIFDQTGSIVDLKEEDTQQVKDIAYINSAYGNSYFGVNQHNGRVLMTDRNGKRGYDRNTNKYLLPAEVAELEAVLEGRKSDAVKSAEAVKALQDSQKMVLRDDKGNPDTSNGSYMIKEEDGQYHEYQRVHTVIGSNYIGPSTGNEATSRGSIVDETARQFLIDPTNVSKPDELSNEAFDSLKRGLGKFREDANRRGLKLVTDRTVVFHKYPDGRRIAGELDVFAYNPSTGTISIFDFKTSKRSTKDLGFSRVENPKYYSRSNKEQYTLQLSAYARLFEDSFNMPVSNLVIIPFQLKYNKDKQGGIDKIYPEAYVPLTYQNKVFEGSSMGTDTAPTGTIKGQYVTMKGGNPEYHQADLRELFTENGRMYYLTKTSTGYKLVLPNGRSMSLEDSLIDEDFNMTKANIMEFLQNEQVTSIIREGLKTSPLENSPYGNSVLITELPIIEPSTDDGVKRGLEAFDRINSFKPVNSVQANQEALNKRESEKKVEVSIDTSTPLGRSQLARKKWGDMTNDEKALISPMFEGMEEKAIQEYWDGTDAIQREVFIPACK